MCSQEKRDKIMVNPTGKARACRAVLVADEEFPAHMGFALLLLPPAMHGAPLVLPLHSALCLVERKEQVCPYQHRVVQPQELAVFSLLAKFLKFISKQFLIVKCSLYMATVVNPKQLPSKPRSQLHQKLL